MENVPVWDDGGALELPALAGDVEAEVCVVGLGGTGLTCAGALLARGVDVVGIDAAAVGGGAAGRNGGFLLAGLARFYHDAVAALGRERALEIYRLTLAEVARIADEVPEAARRVGSLRIAADAAEEADCEAQLAAMRADGLPVERYRGPEGRGLLFPLDCALQPLLRCRVLARRALGAGARLFEGTPALEISPGRVRTPHGVVRCRAVVAAVDGGLEGLFPALAGRVRTARLQMLATAPTDEVRLPRPVYYRWGYEYWQQLPDGRVALGGFRDRAGEEEWTASALPSAPVQHRLERFLRGHLGVHAPVTHRWAASVAYTPDALPLLTRVGENLWALGGYSGTGNVIGALCGRAAAETILDGGSALAVVASP